MPEYLYQHAGLLDKIRHRRLKTGIQHDRNALTLTPTGQPWVTISWSDIKRLSRRNRTMTIEPSDPDQTKTIIHAVPEPLYRRLLPEALAGIERTLLEKQRQQEAADQEQADILRRLTLETEAELAARLDPERWFSWPEMQELLMLTQNFPQAVEPKILDLLEPSCRAKYEAVKEIAQPAGAAAKRSRHNEAYLAQAAPAIARRMKEAAGISLTDEQARAAAVDEPSVRVTAPAGSGKTAVIAAKTVHLSEDLRIPAKQILLLAYNRDAAKELNQRLRRLGNNAKAATFHSFAMKILGAANGRVPNIPALAVDDQARTVFFERKLKELAAAGGNAGREAMELLSKFGIEQHSVFEFDTEAAYRKHTKEIRLRTLNGELVKSYEELIIANWLARHSIPYEYEKPYPAETADAARRQYAPDFYLPEWDVWLEHFALDRRNNPPPGWTGYAAGVQWKRQLHRRQGTRLLESYSWENREGILESELAGKLQELGAGPLNPVSEETLLKRLERSGMVTKVAELLKKFDDAARSDQTSYQEMQKKSDPENRREQLFLRVYANLADEYEKELAEQNGTDFHALINQATEAVKDGSCQVPYTHILVDEFQDISYNRMLLLQALKRQGASIYAVGDDWQSIYRFAGSRVDLFNSPHLLLGYTEPMELTRTFRSNYGITGPAHRFIAKNPAQSQREVAPNRAVPDQGITIIYGADQTKSIRKALNEPELQEVDRDRILILGRYRHTKEDLPERGLRFNTVHAAKGQEADYVIVADLNDGPYGFPSQIADDPLFRLARTPQPEDRHTAYAEERRLFYVALTRARKGIYLLADRKYPSEFVKELAQDHPGLWTSGEAAGSCPVCRAGAMLEKPNGRLRACSMHPVCDYEEPRCGRCNDGYVKPAPGGKKAYCGNPECRAEHEACPSCQNGILAERGKNGSRFLGCNQYFNPNRKCGYTRNLE